MMLFFIKKGPVIWINYFPPGHDQFKAEIWEGTKYTYKLSWKLIGFIWELFSCEEEMLYYIIQTPFSV
jgi:hypothetical protein